MSISLYFGLPGSGKSTFYTYFAVKASKLITKGKLPYHKIYGNMPLIGVPHYECIPFDFVGKYQLDHCLILIDEAGLLVDNRDYKSLKPHLRDFLMLHRHYKCDIMFFNQGWDSLDRKIRVITNRVFYVYKPMIIGRWFSKCYQIPYGIIIPDPKKDDSTKLGEIVQGYCKPGLLKRIFSPLIFRPKYYKYFDSFDAPALAPLPSSCPEERASV